MTIKEIDGKKHYYDINGKEIHEGDSVLMLGREWKVFLTEVDELGVDSTNPKWIQNGRAVEGEYGIYPFTAFDDPVLVPVSTKGKTS